MDGIAFGIFARALERTEEFETLHKRVEGVELADSITVDGHKLLNVVRKLSELSEIIPYVQY